LLKKKEPVSEKRLVNFKKLNSIPSWLFSGLN